MLHTVIHSLVESEFGRASLELDGYRIQVIDLPSTAFRHPLAISFDETFEALAALPRLFIEPDGSFIWLGAKGPEHWKLDGQLNDSPYGLMTVELKISGEQAWEGVDSVLRTVSWPAHPVAFELVRQGVYLDVEAFQELLAAGIPSASRTDTAHRPTDRGR